MQAVKQVPREIDFKPGVHLAAILRESWWVRSSAHDSICLADAIEGNCRNPGTTLKLGPNLNLVADDGRKDLSCVLCVRRSNETRLKGLNEVAIEREMGGHLIECRA